MNGIENIPARYQRIPNTEVNTHQLAVVWTFHFTSTHSMQINLLRYITSAIFSDY